FSSRRRHTRCLSDWSSDVCSSDLPAASAGSVSVITDAIISAALVAFGAPWMAYLLAPFVGMAINSGQLCGHGPPSFPAIGPAARSEERRVGKDGTSRWSKRESKPH